jgi:hypothetical protein
VTYTSTANQSTVTTTQTFAAQATNAVTNVNFTSSNPEQFNANPTNWTISGAMWDVDCTGGDDFDRDDDCDEASYSGWYSWVYSLNSDDDVVQIPDASVSQTLTNLSPGLHYALYLNAGFDNSAGTCIVTYSLDGVSFASFTPPNTYDSNSNLVLMPLTGPYEVKATAASQVLKLDMNCPNAGDNGGNLHWSNVSFYGPYS